MGMTCGLFVLCIEKVSSLRFCGPYDLCGLYDSVFIIDMPSPCLFPAKRLDIDHPTVELGMAVISGIVSAIFP